ncbi:hypothetical protein QSU86_30750, partial [Klebsiella pneumoniae]|nr:hypothetical protein [Klebsiella pneumoniae]
ISAVVALLVSNLINHSDALLYNVQLSVTVQARDYSLIISTGVLDTTMQMYEQWREQQPKLAHPQLEALLRWAAMLHEVGLNINHSGLHRHSAYILQNSDLPGFNQEQQLM